MPTLFLLRHAKTESHHPQGDRFRELTERGRTDARTVGEQLRERGITLVLSSSSMRTRQTVEELGLDARVEYMDALYNCDVETMLQRIGEVDDDVTGLLVVGHSPTIPTLAAELTWAPGKADDIACNFPTAAWAELTFDGDWADLREASLRAVHRPRDV